MMVLNFKRILNEQYYQQNDKVLIMLVIYEFFRQNKSIFSE
jgi:hypothetical protein